MKPQVEEFGSAQVRLRLLREDDLELTREWRNHDDARCWFKHTAIIPAEQHRQWFERYRELATDLIFIVQANGVPVGQASVYAIDLENGCAEVGRFLAAPEARGRGYIGTACSELVEFCRSRLALTLLYLEVRQENERAIRIYQRCGFREVAREDGMIRMELSLAGGSR